MNRNTSALLSTLLILGLLYYFRNPLKAMISKLPSGTPTPGYAAGTLPSAVPYGVTYAGQQIGEVVPGLGFIPQAQLNQNPNAPVGSLGITGYD